MSVAEFPMVSVSSGNPPLLYFEAMPDGFIVGKTVYDDNGADYKLQHGGSGYKRWILKYGGLTAAQAAVIRAHLSSSFYSEDEGSAFGFNFRDRDTAVLYSSVHYAPGGYKQSHTRTWIHSIEILLEKRP